MGYQQEWQLEISVLHFKSFRISLRAPIWVPDFTNLDDVHSLMHYEMRVNFNPFGGTKAQRWISTDGQVLVVKGKEVDSVYLVGSVYNVDAVFTSLENKRLSNGRLFMQSKRFPKMKKES